MFPNIAINLDSVCVGGGAGGANWQYALKRLLNININQWSNSTSWNQPKGNNYQLFMSMKIYAIIYMIVKN